MVRAVDVPEGRWRLLFTPPSSPSVMLRVPPLEAGKPREITVTLPREPTMQRVRFVQMEDDAAMVGAKVTPYYEYGDDASFFAGAPRRTDGLGELLIPYRTELPAFTRVIQWFIETPTHVGVVTAAEFGKHETVYVKAIEKRARIRGKAYRPDGRPAAGTLVVSGRKGYFRRAEVGDDGSYELTGVLASGSAMVLLIAPGAGMPIQSESVRVRPGVVTELDIGTPHDSSRTATLRGRITAGTEPLPALVVVMDANRKRRIARTNAGVYEIKGLQPGRVRLSVVLGDHTVSDDFTIRSAATGLDLKAGEVLTRDFQLPAGVIRVKITDNRGEPLLYCEFGNSGSVFNVVGQRGSANVPSVAATGSITAKLPGKPKIDRPVREN